MAVMATLKRRAVEGGSYRIHLSLARLSIWLLEMGLFDKSYAQDVGSTGGEHAYLPPELFHADTPSGTYQGVTDQVVMSATPGHYQVPLVPQGSSRPEWVTDAPVTTEWGARGDGSTPCPASAPRHHHDQRGSTTLNHPRKTSCPPPKSLRTR